MLYLIECTDAAGKRLLPRVVKSSVGPREAAVLLGKMMIGNGTLPEGDVYSVRVFGCGPDDPSRPELDGVLGMGHEDDYLLYRAGDFAFAKRDRR